ncbi:MAG TPA: cyclic nucleotide-binding domain-containing protein [Polyangiaceae bacterium]|jgi:CRP-like cAMP-binding protein
MRRGLGDLAEDLRVHKDRGAELTAQGKPEMALAEYLAALGLSASDILSRQRAAELLVRLGRPRDAIEHYLCLAGKYAVDGRLLKAIATCHQILQLDPSHAATLATLTDLYAERDTPRGPVRIPSDMAPAIKSSPSQPAPHIDRATLARIPLFSDLARVPFETLLRKFVRMVVKPGSVILEEGAYGDAMFAVATGSVRVERWTPDAPPRVIAEMGEGEFFGEMSLLARCPRFATVVAANECELLRLDRADLDAIVQEHPAVGEVLERFYKERLVANVARASSVFRGLPTRGQRALVDLFRLDVYPAGAMLLEQGAPGGTGLYFLLRGRCDVFNRGEDGTEEPYPSLGEGDLFGEVSLLQGGPVTACVRTSAQSVVLTLHREWADALVLSHPTVRDEIYDLASRRLQRTQVLLAKDLLDQHLV